MKQKGRQNDLEPLQDLKGYIFDLKIEGNDAKKAEKIEKCLEKLEKNDMNLLNPVLRLLYELKDSGDEKQEEKASYNVFRKLMSDKSVFKIEENSDFYPFLDRDRTQVQPYPHFSSKDFEFPTTNDRKLSLNTNMEPKFFKISHENSKLDKIPPLELLTDKNGDRIIRIPREKVEKVKEKSKDEGYESPNKSPGIFDWQDVAKLMENSPEVKRKTWESLGNSGSAAKEKPFLTELSAEKSIHSAWMIAMQNLRLIDPKNTEIPTNLVIMEDPKKFIKDCAYVALGIESKNFFFDKKTGFFKLKHHGLAITGISPEALGQYCNIFLQSGRNSRVLESLKGNGRIFTGFSNGISDFLRGFRKTLLRIAEKKRQTAIEIRNFRQTSIKSSGISRQFV